MFSNWIRKQSFRDICCFKRFYCTLFLKNLFTGKRGKRNYISRWWKWFCFNDTFFHLFVLFHLSVSSVVLLNYDTELDKMLILHVFQVMQLNVENIWEKQNRYFIRILIRLGNHLTKKLFCLCERYWTRKYYTSLRAAVCKIDLSVLGWKLLKLGHNGRLVKKN